ncbi:hypothetical protein KWE88_09600 [Acinetobacter pittii]
MAGQLANEGFISKTSAVVVEGEKAKRCSFIES